MSDRFNPLLQMVQIRIVPFARFLFKHLMAVIRPYKGLYKEEGVTPHTHYKANTI